MDSLTYHDELKKRLEMVETVPAPMREFLVESVQPDLLGEELKKSEHELLLIMPEVNGNVVNAAFSRRGKPLPQVAKDLLRVRQSNRKLINEVLEA